MNWLSPWSLRSVWSQPRRRRKQKRFDGIVEMRTYGFLTVSDILQTRKGAGNWYDGYDDDDRAFKLPSKYKESAGNQTTEIFLFLFFVFIALKVAGAPLIVAVGNPRGPQPLMMSVFKLVSIFVCFKWILCFSEKRKKSGSERNTRGKNFFKNFHRAIFH